MVRTQIQLTEDQAARVRQVAADRNVSMAEAIRQCIDQSLHDALVLDPAKRRRRAAAVSGRFRSGHAVTSESHDAVLAEALRS